MFSGTQVERIKDPLKNREIPSLGLVKKASRKGLRCSCRAECAGP